MLGVVRVCEYYLDPRSVDQLEPDPGTELGVCGGGAGGECGVSGQESVARGEFGGEEDESGVGGRGGAVACGVGACDQKSVFCVSATVPVSPCWAGVLESEADWL